MLWMLVIIGIFLVLVVKLRVSCMLGKCCTAEIFPCLPLFKDSQKGHQK
jgi:hypothetical protein